MHITVNGQVWQVWHMTPGMPVAMGGELGMALVLGRLLTLFDRSPSPEIPNLLIGDRVPGQCSKPPAGTDSAAQAPHMSRRCSSQLLRPASFLRLSCGRSAVKSPDCRLARLARSAQMRRNHGLPVQHAP